MKKTEVGALYPPDNHQRSLGKRARKGNRQFWPLATPVERKMSSSLVRYPARSLRFSICSQAHEEFAGWRVCELKQWLAERVNPCIGWSVAFHRRGRWARFFFFSPVSSTQLTLLVRNPPPGEFCGALPRKRGSVLRFAGVLR